MTAIHILWRKKLAEGVERTNQNEIDFCKEAFGAAMLDMQMLTNLGWALIRSFHVVQGFDDKERHYWLRVEAVVLDEQANIPRQFQRGADGLIKARCLPPLTNA